jgi:putative addiction module component (TIGR02574 family)
MVAFQCRAVHVAAGELKVRAPLLWSSIPFLELPRMWPYTSSGRSRSLPFEAIMSSSPLEELEAAVLALPRADRARLAKYLIESLDEQGEVEEAWEVEVRQRLLAYRAGEATTEEGDDVFEAAQDLLNR